MQLEDLKRSLDGRIGGDTTQKAVLNRQNNNVYSIFDGCNSAHLPVSTKVIKSVDEWAMQLQNKQNGSAQQSSAISQKMLRLHPHDHKSSLVSCNHNFIGEQSVKAATSRRKSN